MQTELLLELYLKLHGISERIKAGETIPVHISHRHGEWEDVIELTVTRKHTVTTSEKPSF